MLAALGGWSCAADDSNGVIEAETPGSANLGFELLTLHTQFEKHVEEGNDPKQFSVANSKVRIVDGSVQVDLVAKEDAGLLATEVEDLAATNIATAGRKVSCLIPLANIEELAKLPNLHSARLSVAATRARKVQIDLTE